MKTEFSPTPKKKRDAKNSIIYSILILSVGIVSTIIGSLQKGISGFQLFCLLPLVILFTAVSIAHDRFRINHEKLLLSLSGVEYEAFASKVFSQWNELKKTETDPSLLSKDIEWIVTTSKEVKSRFLLWQLLKWGRTDHIPIYLFADNWRDSELGQQIKQYAPHLFGKEKSVQSA